MGSSDKFCLRWNDFESNVSSSFARLRDDADFFDVTLASEDDRQIRAHRVILAACSPFFRRVLRANPHERPLLYLKGVRHSQLVSVLDFMYHGEVSVAQDDLNAFLAAAEDLSVKGLTTGQGGQAASSSSSSSCRHRTWSKQGQKSSKQQHHPPSKRPRKEAKLEEEKEEGSGATADICVKDEPRVGCGGFGEDGEGEEEDVLAGGGGGGGDEAEGEEGEGFEEEYGEEGYDEEGYGQQDGDYEEGGGGGGGRRNSRGKHKSFKQYVLDSASSTYYVLHGSHIIVGSSCCVRGDYGRVYCRHNQKPGGRLWQMKKVPCFWRAVQKRARRLCRL